MNITIVTDSGPHIGQGHWQRMLLLAYHCYHNSIPVTVLHKTGIRPPEGFPVKFANSIPHTTHCIIRDMRDSSKEDIEILRAIAPVIVIDDCGQGRTLAHAAIDLLPNIYGTTANTFTSSVPLFLYGYNFYTSLLHAPPIITKDIDCFIYASTFDAGPLCKALKPHCSYVCSNGNTLDANTVIINSAYAELIARSKVVITHFGITVYEALLCGCHSVILNPTDYHEKLSHTLTHPTLKLYHQLYNPADIPHIVNIVKNFVDEGNAFTDTATCINAIQTNLKNFINALRLIITQ
ncbi:MAG: hypothetical protein N3F66_04090 [Spirochaetes bacterium]|nr:hypothetical protein [Spirochaetota bacterium]